MLFGRTTTIAAGGFTPSGSPAGWWPADQITGLEDDDPVGTWPDQSGNSNDLTQATAAKKFTYKENIKNGLPVLRSADRFRQMDSSLSIANEPITFQAVGKRLEVTSKSGGIFCLAGGAQGKR